MASSPDLSAFSTSAQLWLIVKVGVAAALGAVIGWERDRAGKSAGIRTHMLVSSTAALAVGLGVLAIDAAGTGDPTRMMHAVFTGIGFLGAGLIWRSKQTGPFGLTSAATVMLVAGIGAACGLGAPIVAAGVCALALLTLRGLRKIDELLRRPNHHPATDDVD